VSRLVVWGVVEGARGQQLSGGVGAGRYDDSGDRVLVHASSAQVGVCMTWRQDSEMEHTGPGSFFCGCCVFLWLNTIHLITT
jgi:hypothetical protein